MPKKPLTFKTIETFEQLRKCNNVKVLEIADALKIDNSGWSKIKAGKRPFSFDEYVELCEFLNIPHEEPLAPDFDYKKYIKESNKS